MSENAPAQQKDPEAEQFLLQLTRERPDTSYILAQTVIMQDFALRNAQAQISQLQRELNEGGSPPPQQRSGSFLGGLFGGGSSQQPQSAPPPGSVPRVDPWSRSESMQSPPPQGYAPPPPQQAGYGGYGQQGAPGAPVMQPSQTSGFLRNAAATAAGVAGGAMLFQGIQSLFSGHHGGMMGNFNPSNMNPNDSLSKSTVVNNYYGDDPSGAGSDKQYADYGSDQSSDTGGYQEADYDSDDDSDFGGSDDSNYA